VGSSGSLVGVKWTVRGVDHFHLLQRIRMSGVIPLLSLSAFMSCAGANLPFFMKQNLKKQCLKWRVSKQRYQ